MQLGRLEIMDQAAVEHVSKISKVENLEKKHTIEPDEKYKNLSEQVNTIESNEIMLDNVKFGYDKETKQFFVRITTDGIDRQFPTEQIMKMKAHFLQSLNQEL
ncbi:MAG: flagellin [Arcobacteraceae bacterium]|nr:flagellin [Arcobacteraceae bacterium]